VDPLNIRFPFNLQSRGAVSAAGRYVALLEAQLGQAYTDERAVALEEFASLEEADEGDYSAIVRGVETHVERPATEASPGNPGANWNLGQDETLAGSLNTAVYNPIFAVDSGTNDRGLFRTGKYVTRDENIENVEDYHPIRACLLEIEFLSNASARQTLTGENAAALRGSVSESVATGIFNDIETQP